MSHTCPKCQWKLKQNKNDQLAQWTCTKSNCDWMATDKYMESLTKKDYERIQQEIQDTIRFRQNQQAQREIDKIEQARQSIEDKQTVHDVARKYKGIANIQDFMRESDKDEM